VALFDHIVEVLHEPPVLAAKPSPASEMVSGLPHPPPEPGPAQEEGPVTAFALTGELRLNEKETKEKYKGRGVAVTGTVKHRMEHDRGVVSVVLKGDSRGSGVVFQFPKFDAKAKGKASKLKGGRQTAFKGSGCMFLGHEIHLNKCAFL
jgi:hypothetical protein